LLPADGEQLVTEGGRAPCSFGNFDGMPVRRISGRQVHLEKIAIADDYTERVVEVMGHSTRQSTCGFFVGPLTKLFL
jgi:hypothetical protein